MTNGSRADISSPLLVIHGQQDELIPVEEGEALYQAATAKKELFLVPRAGHNDISLAAGRNYVVRIGKWLEEIQ